MKWTLQRSRFETPLPLLSRCLLHFTLLLDPVVGTMRHQNSGFPNFIWCAGDRELGTCWWCGWIPRAFLVQSRAHRRAVKVAHGERGGTDCLLNAQGGRWRTALGIACCCSILGSPFLHAFHLPLTLWDGTLPKLPTATRIGSTSGSTYILLPTRLAGRSMPAAKEPNRWPKKVAPSPQTNHPLVYFASNLSSQVHPEGER